jgi:ATP-dependent exoDNAse (exonuclease V) beta subunit
MGVTYDGTDYGACGFFDKKVWMRTIADLIIIQDDKAFVIDYKTGKNSKYADTKQLDLVAGAVFTHYPQVNKVKSALAFVVSKEFIKKKQDATLRKSYLATFDHQLERLHVAQETNVWNANDTPLCAWCPVKKCPHNRSN